MVKLLHPTIGIASRKVYAVKQLQYLVWLATVLTVLDAAVDSAEPNKMLTVTPAVAQIKAINSKTIFTCTITSGMLQTSGDSDEEYDTVNSKQETEVIWLNPQKQPITTLPGRIYAERLDAHRLRLYITDINDGDSGTYTCKAVLNGKSVVAQSRLDLYEEIKFVKLDDTNISRKAGADGSTLIECQASGKPKPEVSWRFNGRRINGNAAKYTLEKRGLRIKNLTPEDAGVYECRAEVVSQGNLRVATINLDVLYPPVLTLQLDSPTTAVKGSDISLHCEGHGNPSVTYRWFKEVQISSGQTERYAIAEEKQPRSPDDADSDDKDSMTSSATAVNDDDAGTNGTLILRSVDVTDDGKYVCSISNSLGTAETSIQLDILVPPEIKEIAWNGQRRNITLTEGDSIELPCAAAKGHPTPEVYWSIGSQYLNERGDRVKEETQTQDGGRTQTVMRIANATRRDTNTYTCNAVNSVGVGKLDVAIVVNFAPEILRSSENDDDASKSETATDMGDVSTRAVYSWPGQNRTIRCVVIGRPDPDVVWMRDDNTYVEADDTIYSVVETRHHSRSMVISELQVRMPKGDDETLYGVYTCLAKNNIDYDNVSMEIVKAAVPGIPNNVTINKVTATTILLSATIAADEPEVESNADVSAVKVIPTHGPEVRSWTATLQQMARSGQTAAGPIVTRNFSKSEDMLVTGLKPSTTYILSLSAVNDVGVGTPAKLLIETQLRSNDWHDDDVQSDDARLAAAVKTGAVRSSAEHSRSKWRGIDDRENLFSVVDWGHTSAVLVVVGAVMLTTVVAAVLALVLHTRRRMVQADGLRIAARNGRGLTAGSTGNGHAGSGSKRTSNKNGDLNQATSVKVSDGRDVDNLTLEIRGRRPPSPGASMPDQLYRSLGRSAKVASQQAQQQYGSAAQSPRLGARPGAVIGQNGGGGPSSSLVSSPIPSRAVTNQAPPSIAAPVEVSDAQKNAWNQMIRNAADQMDSAVGTDVVVDMSAMAAAELPAAMENSDDANGNRLASTSTANRGGNVEEMADDDDEDDSDADISIDEDNDDDLYDRPPQPVFEGKSFLSYSP